MARRNAAGFWSEIKSFRVVATQLPHASLINDEHERVRAKTIDRWNLS